MKFKFVVNDFEGCATGFFTDWKETKLLIGNSLLPDYDTYSLFKALELNSELDNELIEARKNLHLPLNGLSWDLYKKWQLMGNEYDQKEMERMFTYRFRREDQINNIFERMHLHSKVRHQISNLILGSSQGQEITIA